MNNTCVTYEVAQKIIYSLENPYSGIIRVIGMVVVPRVIALSISIFQLIDLLLNTAQLIKKIIVTQDKPAIRGLALNILCCAFWVIFGSLSGVIAPYATASLFYPKSAFFEDNLNSPFTIDEAIEKLEYRQHWITSDLKLIKKDNRILRIIKRVFCGSRYKESLQIEKVLGKLKEWVNVNGVPARLGIFLDVLNMVTHSKRIAAINAIRDELLKDSREYRERKLFYARNKDNGLFTIESKPAFVETSFWESLSWRQKKSTDFRFFHNPTIRQAHKSFQTFCSDLKSEKKEGSGENGIPRTIHFVWLGKPMPDKFQPMVKSWQKHHPDWECKIWGNDDIANFPWSCDHSKMMYEEAKTWAEKADILRLEAVYQFGGIYSDTDVFCYKSFESLIQSGVQFFAGSEKNTNAPLHSNGVYVGNAIFGARKGSPIIKWCIDHAKTEKEANRGCFSKIFSNRKDVSILERGGPGLLSHGVSAALNEPSSQEKMLILPCSYLFPVSHADKKKTITELKKAIRPESMAVHLWESSWH